MNTLGYFTRLAVNNLRRGGQRGIVALLCIVFGVMSLVAMTQVAGAIERTMVLRPVELVGADISLSPKDGDALLPEQIDDLKQFQQSGDIDRYTLIAYTSTLMFHKTGSGEMHFETGLGITPGEYPLAGLLTISQPGNVGLATLIQQVGDVVITRDIAQEKGLKVGDAIVLSDLNVGATVPGHIRGIAADTPNHQGSKVYYTVETARKLAGGLNPLNTALANSKNANRVGGLFENAGFSVTLSEQTAKNSAQTADFILTCLKGAGILGLLVSGVGIANTMQVLLRRRQQVIAIWKTLGYRENDLRFIFTLEAGLLGLIGSLIGAGLGILISVQLVGLFRRTSNLLFSWSLIPAPVGVAVLVGTLTTVIFALWAIVISSQARPMALLRSEPVDVRQLPWWKSIGLMLVLMLPFTALTSLVMGTLFKGALVLGGVVVGVGGLAAFFGGVMWIFTHLIPLRGLPLAHLAQNSLRRRGIALVFAMVALFVGILSMSFGMFMSQNGQREMSERELDLPGPNINVIAPFDQAAAIMKAVQAQSPQKVGEGYTVSVQRWKPAGDAPIPGMAPVLVGLTDPGDFEVSGGAAWGSRSDGVYVSRFAGLDAGSQVEVTFRDGSSKSLPVIGTYTIKDNPGSLNHPLGLIMPAKTLLDMTRPDTVTFYVRASNDRVAATAAALGSALPDATVINLVAYSARWLQSYQNLLILTLAMSGLALLAGILLVANSVSLAMLERQHEFGVLKAIGYSRRHILTTLGVEYSLVGIIATGAGLGVVRIFLWIMARSNHLTASLLQLTPASIAVIALCGIGLTLLAVLGLAWNPTRVSPLVVLNDH
jgi:putative ABC transport system permease protein